MVEYLAKNGGIMAEGLNIAPMERYVQGPIWDTYEYNGTKYAIFERDIESEDEVNISFHSKTTIILVGNLTAINRIYLLADQIISLGAIESTNSYVLTVHKERETINLSEIEHIQAADLEEMKRKFKAHMHKAREGDFSGFYRLIVQVAALSAEKKIGSAYHQSSMVGLNFYED